MGAEDQSALAPDQKGFSAKDRTSLLHRRGEREACGNNQHIALLRVSQRLCNRPDGPPVGVDVAAARPHSGIDDSLGHARRQGVAAYEQASACSFRGVEGHEPLDSASDGKILDQTRGEQCIAGDKRGPDAFVGVQRGQQARYRVRFALRQGLPDGPQRRLAVFVVAFGKKALAHDAAIAEAYRQQKPRKADDRRQPQAYRNIPAEAADRGGRRRGNIAKGRLQPLYKPPADALQRIAHRPAHRCVTSVLRLVQGFVISCAKAVQHRIEGAGRVADFIPLPQIREQHRVAAGRLRDAVVESLQAPADAQCQKHRA